MEIKVIHADDDPLEVDRVKDELSTSEDGIEFALESLSSADAYLKRIKSGEQPDAVVLDLQFDGEDLTGLDLAKSTKMVFPGTAIIVVTNRDRMVMKALANGANDFVTKDSFAGELRTRIYNAVKKVRAESGMLELLEERPISDLGGAPRTVGRTMRAIAADVKKIANSAIEAVLVTGETGSGKEVVADLFESEVGKPFIRLNCGELNPELLEAELFGSVKGAYTGATQDRAGLIEIANRGWLFLDEIHALPLSGQTALLRVVENKQLRRIGDNKFRNVNVKILVGTNRSLDELVKTGEFREDLLNRLDETRIEIPPLRERKNEIGELIDFFCSSAAGGPYEIDESVKRAFQQYDWKGGNVRELRNTIRAMTKEASGKRLTALGVPKKISSSMANQSEDQNAVSVNPNQISIEWTSEKIPQYSDLETEFFIEYLRTHRRNGGVKTMRTLALEMGLNRQTATERAKKLVHDGRISAEELKHLTGLKP